MKGLSLTQLRYFEALSRLRHFGRAAEACAISQPALSMQIKDLEALMGTTLVERDRRQIRLTAVGEALADRARSILRSVHELEDLARAASSPLNGRLRIGAIPTVAPYLLPRLITALSQRFPNLDLRPRESLTRKLVDDVLAAQLDIAILALPLREAGLQEVTLFDEEFVLVRPLVDADRPVPDARGLEQMRLLLLEEGHCLRDQALSFCQMPAAGSRELMEGSSLATLVQMVGVGIGVTLIPEMALPLETTRAPVAIARLAPPRPRRRIGMIWRRTNPLAEQFADLAGLIRQLVATEIGDNPIA